MVLVSLAALAVIVIGKDFFELETPEMERKPVKVSF